MWIANYASENKGKLLPPRRPNSYMNLSGLPVLQDFCHRIFSVKTRTVTRREGYYEKW